MATTAEKKDDAKTTKGGRRRKEGVKVTFYLKDQADAAKLQKMADDQHREGIDNMAYAIVREALAKKEGHSTI